MKRIAIATVLLLFGCARTTHADGSTMCGTHVPTGAVSILPTPLQSPGPSPGSAPRTDQLPPPVPNTATADYSGADYVQVGGSCDQGAVVVVQPAANAKLLLTIRAGDHSVVIVGLEVSKPVTVQAWRGGIFAGSLMLNH